MTGFRDLSEYGDLYSIKDFSKYCKCGAFCDDDGHGYLATDSQESNMRIKPSDLFDPEYVKNIPEWATHVMWFNR